MAVDLPLTTIGVILAFALVLSIFFKKIGQNPVLGFVLTGFILGPFALDFLSPEDVLVKSFAELGLFVLLFYLGIELSFREFLGSGVPTFSLALADMFASALLGFLISMLSGFSLLFSFAVGIMLFSTSSAIVGKFILDKGMIKQKQAQMALAILILQDFLGILLLVFISSFSSSGSAVELGLTALVFAIVSFYGVHRLSGVVEKFFEKHDLSATELTLYAIGVGLIVATLGSFLGLSAAIGAYFAGFALSELKAGNRVKKQIDFLRDFFLLFFFVAFGATLFFDAQLQEVIIPSSEQLFFIGVIAIVLAIASIIAHGIIFTVFGPLFGLTNLSSSEVAVLLTPLGEFVIIIAISVIPLLDRAEAAVLSPLAFLLILFTLLFFQPLYRQLDLHERITRMIPALAPRPTTEQPVQTHTPESIKLLQTLALNIFILVCLAWITFLLYKTIPEIGIAVPFGRQATTAVLFLFFAVVPFTRIIKAIKKLWKLSIRTVHYSG